MQRLRAALIGTCINFGSCRVGCSFEELQSGMQQLLWALQIGMQQLRGLAD